jgi:hypothetical protein
MKLALSLACLLLASGCGAAFRPFRAEPIVWEDDDRRPFEGPPPALITSWAWDMFDNTVTRQASEALLYRRGREAIDVNALDEVPDSSWYTNRLSRGPMSPDALQLGACAELDAPPPPYVIVRGKLGGTSPGALVVASDGQRYVMKTDLFGQPERGTAGDAIGTRILYAAGYGVPCDYVTAVRREDLVILPGAPRDHDPDEPYTDTDLAELLAAATPAPGATYRVSLSRFLEGELLGGFRFSGVREEDPNDVVPHEHRRELRAFYVVSAWLNHIDARAENNIDVWTETSEGHGYIRHLILDAGDSLGILWDQDIDFAMSRRFGNAHYLDLEQIFGDLFSLGTIDRAYRDPPRGPAFEVLGFYDVERFDPSSFRPGYPNPAFEQRTEADMAWMARILSRLDEPSIRAIVETGHFSERLYTSELVRILRGRLERILERYLVRLSPLTSPELGERELCMEDLAVASGIRDVTQRVYRAIAYEGVPPRPRPGSIAVRAEAARVCVPLSESAPSPGYEVVDLFASTRHGERSHPARVHLATNERGERTVVGLERPDADAPP